MHPRSSEAVIFQQLLTLERQTEPYPLSGFGQNQLLIFQMRKLLITEICDEHQKSMTNNLRSTIG